jgi:DNA-binding PadR family transcriptional regulator
MAIREEIIRATGVNWLLGAIYGPLARLHRRNLVTSVRGEPTPERGGRAKVYYELTPAGKSALKKSAKSAQPCGKERQRSSLGAGPNGGGDDESRRQTAQVGSKKRCIEGISFVFLIRKVLAIKPFHIFG